MREGTDRNISLVRYASFGAGIVLVSVGLELFLRPNLIVPGGVHSISIMLSYITEMQMGLFLFLLHLPVILLTGFRRGSLSAWTPWIGLLLLTLITLLLHPVPPITGHSLAASIMGGLLLGIGTGLVVRNGGFADGVKETALLLKRKTSLSMAELVMLIHIGILALAGFLFGWEQALYSVIAYFLAYRSLQFMLKDRFELVMVWIKSGKAADVKERLEDAYGTKAVWVSSSAYAFGISNELFLILPRTESNRVYPLLMDVDPSASVVITPVKPSDTAEYMKME